MGKATVAAGIYIYIYIYRIHRLLLMCPLDMHPNVMTWLPRFVFWVVRSLAHGPVDVSVSRRNYSVCFGFSPFQKKYSSGRYMQREREREGETWICLYTHTQKKNHSPAPIQTEAC